MNKDINGNNPMPEWFSLGVELLEGSMDETSYQEAFRLLHAPGVDPALYMLFCSIPQGYKCATEGYPTAMWSVAEVRSLMQCAFMLGTYVKKSVGAVEKLW